MNGDAIYSEFVTEIGYQLLTSTKIKTEDNEKENKEEIKEVSTMDCVIFLIDLISECQSSVFQWDSIELDLNH
ncbi:hypothetical protein CL6EHI_c00136 [Entamoeba histolytica]|uniref:Uncharacterized protein n=1 Tax=Entamoeba histolytica TaxID=5759 RepID=A0A175JWT9_ENTHI|nr:hypothetical protein CL6EHI_c00136 [Entamoeba histolytica]